MAHQISWQALKVCCCSVPRRCTGSMRGRTGRWVPARCFSTPSAQTDHLADKYYCITNLKHHFLSVTITEVELFSLHKLNAQVNNKQ